MNYRRNCLQQQVVRTYVRTYVRTCVVVIVPHNSGQVGRGAEALFAKVLKITTCQSVPRAFFCRPSLHYSLSRFSRSLSPTLALHDQPGLRSEFPIALTTHVSRAKNRCDSHDPIKKRQALTALLDQRAGSRRGAACGSRTAGPW